MKSLKNAMKGALTEMERAQALREQQEAFKGLSVKDKDQARRKLQGKPAKGF